MTRVEALGSGNYDAFSFMDERLGMFGNRHRILNEGRFHAASRQLSVSGGTTIEFYKAFRFEVDLRPIDVPVTGETALLLTASHGGSIAIARETNTLILRSDFYRSGTGGGTNELPAVPSVEVKAFRNGIVSGSCLTANNSIIGQLTASNQSAPQIIGFIATTSSNSVPTIAFSVDRLATFICTNGSEIVGTHFQISYVDIDPQFLPENIYDLNIIAVPPSTFTITGERSESAQPRLSIAATDDTVTLTWPDNTRLFRLESSPTIPGGFSTVSAEPNFVNNQNEITLPRETTGSRFFRLRSGPD